MTGYLLHLANLTILTINHLKHKDYNYSLCKCQLRSYGSSDRESNQTEEQNNRKRKKERNRDDTDWCIFPCIYPSVDMMYIRSYRSPSVTRCACLQVMQIFKCNCNRQFYSSSPERDLSEAVPTKGKKIQEQTKMFSNAYGIDLEKSSRNWWWLWLSSFRNCASAKYFLICGWGRKTVEVMVVVKMDRGARILWNLDVWLLLKT